MSAVTIRLGVKDADVVKRALEGVGRDGQAAQRRLERAGTPASRSLRLVDASTSELKASMQGAVSRAGPLGAGLAALGPAGLAAAAGLGAAVLAARQLSVAGRAAIDFVAALKDQAEQAGTTVSSLQELEFAARQTGVSQDALVDGLKEGALRADEFAETAKGAAAEAFQRLGITAGDLNERLGDSAAIFALVIERLDALDVRGGARIRILDEIFGGTAGEQFVRFAERGAAGIAQLRREARELGLVMDDSLVARADKTADRLRVLEQVASINLKSALVDLGPALVATAQAFAEVARFVADVVDGFRDLENRSTAGLEREAEAIAANIERLEARIANTTRRGGRGGLTELERDLRNRRAALAQIDEILSARSAATVRRSPVSVTGSLVQADDLKVLEDVRRQLVELAGTDAEKAEAFIARFTERLSDMASPELRAAVAEEAENLRQATVALKEKAEAQAAFNRDAARAASIVEGVLTPTEQLAARQAELSALFRDGHFGEGARGAELYQRAVEQANAELGGMGPVLDSLEQGSSRVFSSMVSGATSASEALGQLLNQLAQAIAQPVFAQAGGFVRSSVAGLFAAQGAAFDGGGRVQAFARGGVVTAPTLFGHSGGLGVMGEGGRPEAVLPLERLPGGDLGVRAAGGGTTVFIDARGAAPGVEQDIRAVIRDELAGAAPQIVRAAVDQTSEEIRRGRFAGAD